jgi:hypothetical protein
MAVCVANAAHAAEPFAKVGTYAMQWLGIPRGVRSIGMGVTGTADASGLGTGIYNPASMAFVDATYLEGSYQDLGLDIELSDVVLSSPIPFRSDSTAGAWKFGASVGYGRLWMEPQQERTIFLPDGTGRTFDASDWGITALGAASWTSGIANVAAGATGKYLKSNLGAGSATAWALDLGVLTAFPMSLGSGVVRPRVGYALTNLDTGVSYDDRNSEIANERRGAFGLDLLGPPVPVWGRQVPGMSLSVDYDHVDHEYQDDRYSAGLEASFVGLMHLRYGTYNGDYDTYGIGLSWDYGNVLLRIDYAHEEIDDGIIDDRDTFGALVGMRW